MNDYTYTEMKVNVLPEIKLMHFKCSRFLEIHFISNSIMASKLVCPPDEHMSETSQRQAFQN